MTTNPPSRLSLALHHARARAMMALYAWCVNLLHRICPRRRPAPRNCEILLTGRFESVNWALAHLKPLAASSRCRTLVVVTPVALPEIPKVIYVKPSPWIESLLGATPARLVGLAVTALRRRPDLVGGFALFPNGLAAALLAPLVGARAMFFCTGGPNEILDGAIHTESGPFARMVTPDLRVQQRLTQTLARFDLVITMGSKAAEFFRRHTPAAVHVVSGGVEPIPFPPSTDHPSFDLIFVGRLAEIKRLDLFLRTVARAAESLPSVSAVLVGDGPRRAQLEQLARDLGIGSKICFAGPQSNPHDWLNRSRIFVLTSRSEGLSLALMEAMMCGLPAVVANVGDLGDLVQHGKSGFLIDESEPEAFARPIVALLRDPTTRETFAHAAHQSARNYEISRVSRQWDEILDHA